MSTNRKMAAVLCAAIGCIAGLVYFFMKGGSLILSGIVAVLVGLILNVLVTARVGGSPATTKQRDVHISRSFVTPRQERKVIQSINLGGKYTGTEEILHLEKWHWRIILSDASLPLLVDAFIVWGMLGFTGRPRTREDMQANYYAWSWVAVLALAVAVIWLANHLPRLKRSKGGVFRAAGILALWVAAWGLFRFPGLDFVSGFFTEAGNTGFWLRWLALSAAWTLYMSKQYFWGYFGISGERTFIALLPPLGLPEKVEQIATGRVSKYDDRSTILGRVFGYGGLMADTDSDRDRRFHRIFPLRHHKEANEAMARAHSS